MTSPVSASRSVLRVSVHFVSPLDPMFGCRGRWVGDTSAVGGTFGLQWEAVTDVAFSHATVARLTNPLNENKPVKISRDGQELPAHAGNVLVALFEEAAAALNAPRPPRRAAPLAALSPQQALPGAQLAVRAPPSSAVDRRRPRSRSRSRGRDRARSRSRSRSRSNSRRHRHHRRHRSRSHDERPNDRAYEAYVAEALAYSRGMGWDGRGGEEGMRSFWGQRAGAPWNGGGRGWGGRGRGW